MHRKQYNQALNHLSDAIRILGIDAVENAKSGHPGMVLGAADIITTLFSNHLVFNPENPEAPYRDKFILSAGHGSMLLYSILHLTGYNVTIDDIKNFRTDKTDVCFGHPELDISRGIECSTGPLGQGVAMAVGMAIASKILQQNVNKELFNQKIYCLAGDGCLMEGLTYEALSIAGHLGLDNLIVIFDSNKISIDGSTDLTISEDHILKMQSFGFNTTEIDGHNIKEIDTAFTKAKTSNKPYFIKANTIMAFGANKKQGSEKAHGAPLGADEIKSVRENLNWKESEPFKIPQDVCSKFALFSQNNKEKFDKRTQLMKKFQTKYSQFTTTKNINFNNILKKFKNTGLEIRGYASLFLESVANFDKNFISGCADLSDSVKIKSKQSKPISKNNFKNSFIHYGVREHAMAAIGNGIVISGLQHVCGTFLIFSDYLKPAIRLSALMKLPHLYIFSHDSILIGQDGPTHQPIEHLTALRSIPNVNVFRPCDEIELKEAFESWKENVSKPTVIVVARSKLPLIRKFYKINQSKQGAYLIDGKFKRPDIAIYASGSEVSLAMEVKNKLSSYKVNIISVPCIEKFEMQSEQTQSEILFENKTKLKVAIEFSSGEHLKNMIGRKGMFFGVEKFAISASGTDVAKHLELTAEKIANKIEQKIKSI